MGSEDTMNPVFDREEFLVSGLRRVVRDEPIQWRLKDILEALLEDYDNHG